MRCCHVLLAIGISLLGTRNIAGEQYPRTEAQKRAWYYDGLMGETYNDTYRVAAKIKPGKPVGEFEAYVLCSAYFFAYINGCGGAELPKLRGDKWIADSVVGYAGSPGPKITVDRKTAITYSAGRETVKDPKVYLKFIKKDLTKR